MPIFDPPAGLVQVAHFTVPAVQTWGGTGDAEYRERVRQEASFSLEPREGIEWFVFRIRCVVGKSRGRIKKQIPLTGNKWHLYWMRKFDAWWPYPLSEQGRKFTLQARLQQLLDDEYGCFWV